MKYRLDMVSEKMAKLRDEGIVVTDNNNLPYHNHKHVEAMLWAIEKLFNAAVESSFIIVDNEKQGINLLELLVVAAAWHDAQNIRGILNNEAMSAQLLSDRLAYRSDITPWEQDVMNNLICSTEYELTPDGLVQQFVRPKVERSSEEIHYLGMLPQSPERRQYLAQLEFRLRCIFADADLVMMALPKKEYLASVKNLSLELGKNDPAEYKKFLKYQIYYLAKQPLNTQIAMELYREARNENGALIAEIIQKNN